MKIKVLAALLCGTVSQFAASSCARAAEPVADTATIKSTPNQWTLSTSSVEKVVALENGRFSLKSLKNKTNNHELAAHDANSDEFFVTLGVARIGGNSGGWKLVTSKTTKLKGGESQLDITLQREDLRVTKTYVVYPGSSIIREWCTFTNAGTTPLAIAEPGFLDVKTRLGALDTTDFNWMSGGENNAGSWLMRTEKARADGAYTFDAYDNFPQGLPGKDNAPGDGINAKILLNDRQIYPAQGFQYVANSKVVAPFDVKVDIKVGDKLSFVVNRNQQYGYDTTAFDPTISYDDGEAHTASKEFSETQGGNNWRYQAQLDGQNTPFDLTYLPAAKQWRGANQGAGTPFVGVGDEHPDTNADVMRVWTAAKAGTVRITGNISNTGNIPTSGRGGFHAGTASYAPWNSLYNRDTKDGIFVGWDYFGRWGSSFTPDKSGAVATELRLSNYKQTLAPNESLVTPKAFVGLYRDDLDNAGNESLDWQYRYLWDYTRDQWFPAIRVLGVWSRGTGWQRPGVGWVGGDPDWPSLEKKVFRTADLMSQIGGDVYHRDWGWWDVAGDWNGPDFRKTGAYLRKHEMGQLIYSFIYTVSPESKLIKAHPDWGQGGVGWGGITLDLSKPDVVAQMKKQLDTFHDEWGDFEWRNDSLFTVPVGGDNVLLAQDQNFRDIMKTFLDKYPQSSFQAVNGGGNYVGYDYTRYAAAVSFSDGAVGILRNYYASLMLPPDKSSDIPDVWNPDAYNPATWRGLLCINFDMTGDTIDPGKLEGLRQLIDIYHYLGKQGVVGRWVHVFRPTITGDDPTLYFQRQSRDGLRGIIIPKRPAPGAVTIKPKGLLPKEMYQISFQESAATSTRTGEDIMARGITLDTMPPGELIYLNLPLHPGSKADATAPTAPKSATKKRGDNMGYPGVEIAWQPGTDNNWVSYYEVLRDGVVLDKVAKGGFYFDHSLGADAAATYTVRTFDGAGNASPATPATGAAAKPATIVDDAKPAWTYTGPWQHQNERPAQDGTLTICNQKGASAEVTFEGKRVIWFAKTNYASGKAEVSIDGGAPEVVDTFTADDIWGMGIWRHEFPTAGKHTLKITVVGEHNPRSGENFVQIDGVRVEQE